MTGMRELMIITEGVDDARLDELVSPRTFDEIVGRFKQEVKGHLGLDDFETYLRERGFTPLGFGGFGIAFMHPNFDYVIKLFANDPHYVAYLKLCLANQDNPHVPKFRGKFMRIDEAHYAVRMERLEAIPKANPVRQLLWAFTKAMWTTRFPSIVWSKLRMTREFDAGFAGLNDQPGLQDWVDTIVGTFGGRCLDLHGGNIMLRGSTIVILDPVAANGD